MKWIAQIGSTTALILLSVALIDSAYAMNWEGHDDWLENEAYAKDLKLELPRPKSAPLPDCRVRQDITDHNPYEQRPIPGLNCRCENQKIINRQP